MPDTTDKPLVTLIAAMAENRVIGRGGGLPWKLPDDMRFFMRTTTGHSVVMGRGNADSLDRKPLPNRRNIVITHRTDYAPAGFEVVHGIEEAIDLMRREEQVFIIGGQSIYELALPIADRILLTVVHAQVEGDRWFPPFDESQWELVDEQHHPADDRHTYAMTFKRFDRKHT